MRENGCYNVIMKSLFLSVCLFLFFLIFTANAQTTVISNPYSSTVDLGQATANNQALPVVACTDLSYDLFYGLSDSGQDQSVLKLQNYLLKTGYLNATPNGYFGPATLSAVKRFQTANSISSTGRVGPITRKAIKDKSCASSHNNPPVSNSNTNPAVVDQDKITVISPVASSTLASDSKHLIQWKSVPNSIYSISLEDKYGVGAGHVAQSVSGNSYEWTVGKVFSTKVNREIFVVPGVYRIHMINSGFVSSVPEQYSDFFTIIGKPIKISAVLPTTVSNKESSQAVIYGDGFDDTTMIHFDINNNGRKVKPHYISTDGKILIFNVPQGLYPNQYWLTVNNTYSEGATSTPSNPVSFTVTNQ